MKTELSRITIDVPKKIHQKFKAFAASKGMSMKELLASYIDTQLKSQPAQECPYSHMPNKRTIKAIKDSYNKKNLVEAKDMADLIKKLSR